MKTPFAIRAYSRSEDLDILVREDDSQIHPPILSVTSVWAFMKVGLGWDVIRRKIYR